MALILAKDHKILDLMARMTYMISKHSNVELAILNDTQFMWRELLARPPLYVLVFAESNVYAAFFSLYNGVLTGIMPCILMLLELLLSELCIHLVRSEYEAIHGHA